MSRVEDDREAARLAAKLAEQKRVEEQQRTKKVTENAQFSKLVAQQKQQGQVIQQQSAAKSAIAQLLEKAEAGKADLSLLGERTAQGQKQEGAFRSSLGAKSLGDRVHQQAKAEGEQTASGRTTDEQGAALAGQGREIEAAGQSASAEGRRGDARTNRERAAERQESSDSGSSGQGGEAGKTGKGELKTDADKGGGQQGGHDSKEGGNQNGAPATMRFNPALMAPPPVAKQRDMAGSERLRKVAAELAQKIVERVRVGTNAAGRMEFQVDLRQDVLSGLTVKVSAHQGRIKAVFSGNDRNVLKLIQDQGEALKAALSARGLQLEEFKIEARP